MANTFYDHLLGILSYFDAKTGKSKDFPIRFLDSPAPTNHSPRFPNLDYQKKYTDMAYEALEQANRNARFGFVLDNARNDGFPGAGYMDGNFVMFLVREDKRGEVGLDGRRITPSDADYRFELSAFDDLFQWGFQGREAVLTAAVRRLKDLDLKG